MTSLIRAGGGNLQIGELRAPRGGYSSVAEISGGANVTIGNVYARDYTDFGMRVRDSQLSIGGGKLTSKQARFGLDFERDTVANLHDLTVKGHRDADIRYGPGVTADLHNVTAREIYDQARRKSDICSSTPMQIDLLLNSTERQRIREQRLQRLLRGGSVVGSGITVAQLSGLL